MKKVVIIVLACSVLIIAGIVVLERRTMSSPASVTAKAQAVRITSHLLFRRIERLRDAAVYLQHREEGAALLGETPENVSEEEEEGVE